MLPRQYNSISTKQVAFVNRSKFCSVSELNEKLQRNEGKIRKVYNYYYFSNEEIHQ